MALTQKQKTHLGLDEYYAVQENSFPHIPLSVIKKNLIIAIRNQKRDLIRIKEGYVIDSKVDLIKAVNRNRIRIIRAEIKKRILTTKIKKKLLPKKKVTTKKIVVKKRKK